MEIKKRITATIKKREMKQKEKKCNEAKKNDRQNRVRVCVRFVAQYFVLHETVIVFSLYTKERRTNNDEVG